MERLIHECEIPSDIVRLIHNAVDTNRFRSRTELPHKPRRALIFSNYAGPGTHLEPILQTCSVLNIQADVVGSGMGVSSRAPEDVLPGYDLVFCECALRSGALAVGKAVILCDTRGLGQLVKRSDVAELRDWNFGMRCLQRRLLPGLIIDEILSYDREECQSGQFVDSADIRFERRAQNVSSAI